MISLRSFLVSIYIDTAALKRKTDISTEKSIINEQSCLYLSLARSLTYSVTCVCVCVCVCEGSDLGYQLRFSIQSPICSKYNYLHLLHPKYIHKQTTDEKRKRNY